LTPTLERLAPAAKLALSYAALLPADHVALSWLRALVAPQFPEVAHDAAPGYPDPWRNLLRCLFSLRLLQVTGIVDADGQPRLVRVHRLLQELLRGELPADQLAARQQAVDALVTERDAVLRKETH
jgi:hypothetical protein